MADFFEDYANTAMNSALEKKIRTKVSLGDEKLAEKFNLVYTKNEGAISEYIN